MKPSGLELLLWEVLFFFFFYFLINSISLLLTGLFRFSVSFESVLIVSVFLGIHPSHLSYLICCTIVHSTLF